MSMANVLAADLDIFLRDFGVQVTIDGTPCIALIDDQGQGPDEARENVNVRVRRVVVREDALTRPKAGRVLVLDGEQWVVSRTESHGGLLEMIVYREMS